MSKEIAHSRKEAIAEGLKKYFTGEACRNGHVSPRYTQSGSCCECINGSDGASRKQVQAAAQVNRDLAAITREVAASLTDYAYRVAMADVHLLKATAAALVDLRYPGFGERQSHSSRAPKNPVSGTCMYFVRVHPEDINQLQAFANSLFSARCAKTVDPGIKEQNLRVSLLQQDAEACPVPEFKP